MKKSTDLRKNWLETKEKLKIKFAELTDNDLLFKNIGQTELTERLQKKLGLSKEEIQKIIADL